MKKEYFARCYQVSSGRFLKLDELDKYEKRFYAECIQDAWEQVAELEGVDSEISIAERWNVFELS